MELRFGTGRHSATHWHTHANMSARDVSPLGTGLAVSDTRCLANAHTRTLAHGTKEHQAPLSVDNRFGVSWLVLVVLMTMMTMLLFIAPEQKTACAPSASMENRARRFGVRACTKHWLRAAEVKSGWLEKRWNVGRMAGSWLEVCLLNGNVVKIQIK